MAIAEQNCCLCFANGESRAGQIPEGGGIPMCAEHRARMIEKSRQPAPPQIVTNDGHEVYLRHCTRCALEGRNDLGLASIVRRAGQSVH